MAFQLAIVSRCDNPSPHPEAVDFPYVHAENLTKEGQWLPLQRHITGHLANLELISSALWEQDLQEMFPKLEDEISTLRAAHEFLQANACNVNAMNKNRETLQLVWCRMQSKYRNTVEIMQQRFAYLHRIGLSIVSPIRQLTT